MLTGAGRTVGAPTACALVLGVALAAGGCSGRAADLPSPAPATTASPAGSAPVSHLAAPDAGRPLHAAVERLERTSSSRLAVAVVPVGSTGAAWTAGSLAHQVAWSTAKVPVSLAVLAAGHHDARTLALVRRALTLSDNQAAERLYALLGDPAHAAAATRAELRRAGDTATTVPVRRLRPGFTVAGQTDWTPAAQARFMAVTACRPAARPVLQLMGQVVPGQRWGLGRVPGARFKGGWGPNPTGRYDVRQMGVVTLRGRQYAVALAADAPSFGEGTRLLDQLATDVAAHPPLGSGRC